MTATPEPANQFIDRDGSNAVDLMGQDGHHSSVDQGFTWLVQGVALSGVIVLGWMSWVIFRQAQPAIEKFGFGFLWTENWDTNEVASSAIALIIALSIVLAITIVTSERFLPPWIRFPIAFVVKLIVAIPNVIVGLWGIFILISVLQPIQQGLFQHLSWILIFNSEPAGLSMLIAGTIFGWFINNTIRIKQQQ